MIQSWFEKWADAALARDNEVLRRELSETQAKLRIAELEITELAAVLERNRRRVEAETAVAAATIAQAEGKSNAK